MVAHNLIACYRNRPLAMSCLIMNLIYHHLRKWPRVWLQPARIHINECPVLSLWPAFLLLPLGFVHIVLCVCTPYLFPSQRLWLCFQIALQAVFIFHTLQKRFSHIFIVIDWLLLLRVLSLLCPREPVELEIKIHVKIISLALAFSSDYTCCWHSQ